MRAGRVMALSQYLDDSPAWRTPRSGQDSDIKELYNETHRLALEALISGGVDSFMDFLKKERIPNFLSDEEVKRICHAAVVPRCASFIGDDSHLEQAGTLDCSSVTYFPEISDIEPPLLEIGWPAFTSGSFRGVTRAVAYFQPSYGESIYSCKEAARKMIKNAKEVIAIVTDSLTDLDIFRDLQEASSRRRVPVYVLLDQSALPGFLQMCKNVNVRLDELLNMRVRTITGSTYFLRSGARITGKVHERFMLVDGNRVATGSYRFNWTDGRLNSSNLIELSGQITEKFDEEFRILYAQSLPLNTRAPSSVRNSGIYEHLLLKAPATPASQLTKLASACMTSTPSGSQTPAGGAPPVSKEMVGEGRQSGPASDTSTLGEDFLEQELGRDAIAADLPRRLTPTRLDEKFDDPVCTQTVGIMTSPVPLCHHTSTQTSFVTSEDIQSETPAAFHQLSPPSPSSANSPSESTTSGSTPPRDQPRPPKETKPTRLPVYLSGGAHVGTLRECLCRLAKERQYHYTTIRSKLDHMMMMLAHRREQVDLTGLGLGSGGLHRVYRGQVDTGQVIMDGVLTGNWPRPRCVQ